MLTSYIWDIAKLPSKLQSDMNIWTHNLARPRLGEILRLDGLSVIEIDHLKSELENRISQQNE